MLSRIKESAPVVIIGLAFSIISILSVISGIFNLAEVLHNLTGLNWQGWNILLLAIGLSMIIYGLFLQKPKEVEGQEISDSQSKDRILKIIFAPVTWCIDRCRQFIDWANSDSGNKSFDIVKQFILTVVVVCLGLPLLFILFMLMISPFFLFMEWLESLL